MDAEANAVIVISSDSSSSSDESSNESSSSNESTCPFSPSIRVAGNVLGPRQYRVLTGGSWFTDDIVNGYMHHLIQRQRAESGKPSIATLSSFLYASLEKKDPVGTLSRWLKSHNVCEELETVLIPVNQAAMHWILVVWEVRMGKLRCFDSMSEGKTRVNMLVLKRLAAFINEYIDSVRDPEEKHGRAVLERSSESKKDSSKADLDELLQQLSLGSESCVIPRITVLDLVQGLPQQSDGSSCGVFTCKYAKCIVFGESLEDADFDPFAFRREMIASFLEHGRSALHK